MTINEHRATVFLSCGQCDDEAIFAEQIQEVIEHFGFRCYNANSQHCFEDVNSILASLAKADYYLFIDFKRNVDSNNDIPISIFSHQEFALAKASGFTNILAFQEEGLRSYGLCQYLLVHPIKFNRNNLVYTVFNAIKQKIKDGLWSKTYSRNLVIKGLIEEPEFHDFGYGGRFGKNFREKIWHFEVENRRNDCVAANCTAILKSITPSHAPFIDRTYLKWAGQRDAFQKHIFPGLSEKFDAFALRENGEGIFLHSSCDISLEEKPLSSDESPILNKTTTDGDSVTPRVYSTACENKYFTSAGAPLEPLRSNDAIIIHPPSYENNNSFPKPVPLITQAGEYTLEYYVSATSFLPLIIKVKLEYIKEPGCDPIKATLVDTSYA